MSELICARCGGEMQAGFVSEEADSRRAVAKWIEGDPQVPWTRFGVKIAERAQYPIQTFRCGKCGYLESYARG
jgi:ribosomal protein S27AE